MALRCVYVDLDGTLLGWGASLFHDGEGKLTMDGVRAVEACLRADVEICIYSGRRQAQVLEDARLMGRYPLLVEGNIVRVFRTEVVVVGYVLTNVSWNHCMERLRYRVSRRHDVRTRLPLDRSRR